MRPPGKILCTLLILFAVLIIPAMAGTEYMAGSPQLSASLSGTNEFSPGEEAQIEKRQHGHQLVTGRVIEILRLYRSFHVARCYSSGLPKRRRHLARSTAASVARPLPGRSSR